MINNKKHINCSFNFAHILLVLCVLVLSVANANAQTAMVTNNFVWYPSPDWTPQQTPANFQCTVPQIKALLQADSLNGPDYLPLSSNDNPTADRSFVTTPVSGANVTSSDPWVNSALIEFDNVFPDSSTVNPKYPNHCLTLCAEVTCSNPVRQVEMSSGSSGSQTTVVSVASGDFPIQSILFDIFKYQAGANP